MVPIYYHTKKVKCDGIEGPRGAARHMTEQNLNYITKEIGKLLSEIWRIKGLAEQEYGPQHPITKKLASMHADAGTTLLQGKKKMTFMPEAPSADRSQCHSVKNRLSAPMKHFPGKLAHPRQADRISWPKSPLAGLHPS